MRTIGIILVILGVLGFIFGGISFTRDKPVAKIGGLEVETKETHTVPVAPIASTVAVVAGLVLAVAGSRGRRAA